MRKFIFILTFSLCSFTLLFGQNCNAGARVAAKAWAKTGKWNNPVSLVPFKNQFQIKKKAWNAIVGNSSATWGPRHIPMNSRKTGTVHGGTKRTFVSNPLFYNRAQITLNKTAGRGRTVVLVCTHDHFGNSQGVTEYEFPNSGLTSSKSFTIPNVRGKIISVAISCKTALRSFSYNINVNNID